MPKQVLLCASAVIFLGALLPSVGSGQPPSELTATRSSQKAKLLVVVDLPDVLSDDFWARRSRVDRVTMVPARSKHPSEIRFVAKVRELLSRRSSKGEPTRVLLELDRDRDAGLINAIRARQELKSLHWMLRP